MLRHLFTLAIALILASSAPAFAQRQVIITRIDPATAGDKHEIRISRDSAAVVDAVCLKPTDELAWRVDGWVKGNELFKNYIDPDKLIPNPYPFSITEVIMPVYFASATILYVAVDIEAANFVTAECPWPDSVLAISTDYVVHIPEAGIYEIAVPLDEPIAVDGPFFAGFFIGNSVDSTAGAAVICDDNAEASCRSYNIWDEEIGFVDLPNNGVMNFPGQLLLHAAGIPGDRLPQQPPPDIAILTPGNDAKLFRNPHIWVHESSGSNIIECVTFEFGDGDRFVEFFRDYDGSRPLRDGVNPSGHGDGWAADWDISGLEEGNYTLRVTAFDTLGRTASDEVTVFVDPSPPTPKIVSPETASDFCADVNLLVSCPDENLRHVTFYYRQIEDSYSTGLSPLLATEYGDFFDGPVAAAIALRFWAEKKQLSLPKEIHTVEALVDEVAARFRTRDNKGTTDENLFTGLQTFFEEYKARLNLTTYESIDYSVLRCLVEQRGQTVLLALGGTPGTWLAVDGFEAWRQDDGSYLVAVCNPISGGMELCPMRQTPLGPELNFIGNWQPIDRVITIGSPDWKIDRDVLATDDDDLDGWAHEWTPRALPADARYFVCAEAVDHTGLSDSWTILLNHDCSDCFEIGDYDGDGCANLVDLAYLIDFVAKAGPAPRGGEARADANGDSYLNVTDIVYYMNYLYGGADPPRH